MSDKKVHPGPLWLQFRGYRFCNFGPELSAGDFRSRFVSDFAPVLIPEQALADNVDVRTCCNPLGLHYEFGVGLDSRRRLL